VAALWQGCSLCSLRAPALDDLRSPSARCAPRGRLARVLADIPVDRVASEVTESARCARRLRRLPDELRSAPQAPPPCARRLHRLPDELRSAPQTPPRCARRLQRLPDELRSAPQTPPRCARRLHRRLPAAPERRFASEAARLALVRGE